MNRLNNFDALRLLAAFFVLFSHQYPLNGLPEPLLFGSLSFGTLGVMVFFSISGFLVSQSWRQDPHAGRFLLKRFLRIWPGLAAFTLLAALVLGPLVTTLSLQNYVRSPEFLTFFENLKVLSIRHYLPGVFESNPYPKAVNGSLWTIPIEVRCYLALLVFAIAGLAKKPYAAVFCTAGFAIYYFGFAPDPTDFQYHYGLYFFTGACLDLLRQRWESRLKMSWIAACVIVGALFWLDAPRVALLILIVSSSVFIGTRSTPVLNKFGRFGDLSYGIYVYAFAVQQTFLWVVGEHYPFVPGLLICAAITTCCASLSWHWVESPALRMKAMLRRAPLSAI